MGEIFKMKNVFVDSDILLDLFMKREPYYLYSAGLFDIARNGDVSLSISSVSLVNIYYVLRKIAGFQKTKLAIKSLFPYLTILNVDSFIIEYAMDSDFTDFEDAVQYFTAKINLKDIIITRNKKDYKVEDVSIMTAQEFLKII